MTRTPLSERFWPKVAVAAPDECWTWVGASDSRGYGKLARGPKAEGLVYAHRAAYELAYGPIPAGKVIDHLCRTPACVNPTHLEAVTQRENVLRGETLTAANLAKTHCPRGHPLEGPNLYMPPGRRERHCRTCTRARKRAAR